MGEYHRANCGTIETRCCCISSVHSRYSTRAARFGLRHSGPKSKLPICKYMSRAERVFAFSLGIGVLIVTYNNASYRPEAVVRAKQTVEQALPKPQMQETEASPAEVQEEDSARFVKIEGKLYQ